MDKTLSILIIDDSPDDRENYIRLLKKAHETGFCCHEATDGTTGMDTIRTFVPACILLDYSLPGANGLEVLKRIRLEHPYMPVIMLTGQGNEAIAVQAIKHGADDYLVKSAITVEGLSRSIRTAVAHSRLQSTIDEQRNLLLKNETRCQQLIDGVRDHAFVWLDTAGHVESWNSGAEKMKGYTADEILGQHFSLFFTEEDQRNRLPSQMLHNTLASGQFSGEGWRVRKDGSTFWANVQINILRNDAGEPVGFVKVTRDITERRNAELERQQLMDKLMQSNTELERFAYVASHDMQEPVRMVMNFGNIIARDYGDRLDEAGKEYLKFITESADRIHSMIDDLLDYARIDGEEHSPTIVDGVTELGHVLANLGTLIQECGAQVTCDFLPSFRGNPIQFMRLMQNLIVNAIKYQPPGNTPKIYIGAENQESMWCISVKDNGIGIDEAFVSKIFEPFRRLHSWERVRGTGLGLAVCKKIVENHGGKIWVGSTPGQGSTFFFTLPKSNLEKEQAA